MARLDSARWTPEGILLPDGRYLPPIAGGDDPPGDPAPKMVPEADLIALKASHATEIAQRDSQLGTLKKEASDLRAANAQVETLGTQLTTANADLEKSKGELEAASKARDAATERLAAQVKSILKDTFKIPDDKLEGKSLEQLESWVEVLQAAPSSTSKDYLVGGGGGGGSPPTKGAEKVRAGLAAGELKPL